MIQVKLLVYHAAPVNSMTLWVDLCANFVQIRLTLVAKEETPVAQLAPQVGPPKTVVPNVPRAVRVRLVTVARIAPSGLREKELTQMPLNANNVNWVKPQRS